MTRICTKCKNEIPDTEELDPRASSYPCCTKCNLEMSYGEYVRYIAHSDSTYSDILGDYADNTDGQTSGSLDEWD